MYGEDHRCRFGSGLTINSRTWIHCRSSCSGKCTSAPVHYSRRSVHIIRTWPLRLGNASLILPLSFNLDFRQGHRAVVIPRHVVPRLHTTKWSMASLETGSSTITTLPPTKTLVVAKYHTTHTAYRSTQYNKVKSSWTRGPVVSTRHVPFHARPRVAQPKWSCLTPVSELNTVTNTLFTLEDTILTLGCCIVVIVT